MNTLEKFKVYGKAIELLALANNILMMLPKGHACISDQLLRSAISIPLNIAEGAGKLSPRDRQRFFSIARGSSFEVYAVLDACLIMNLVETSYITEGQNLLREIVAMLTPLTGCRRT